MHIPTALYSSMRFNFLYVDRYVFRRGWVYPESYIPYSMLRYILTGEGVFIINGRRMVVREGQVSYIPEGCMLECYSLGDELQFISVRFTTTVQLNHNDFLSEFFHIPLLTDQVSPEVLGYFQEIYHNATSENTSRLFRIRGNLELILAALVERTLEAQKEDTEAPEASFSLESIRRREARSLSIKRDPRIQVVVDYLIAHPSEAFDEDSLSRIADMSKSNLRKLFKEHTGKSPRDFIKDLRMTTAARQLLTSDKPISTIAYEVGYEDLNYFSRVFKSVFGISPREYRKGARE